MCSSHARGFASCSSSGACPGSRLVRCSSQSTESELRVVEENSTVRCALHARRSTNHSAKHPSPFELTCPFLTCPPSYGSFFSPKTSSSPHTPIPRALLTASSGHPTPFSNIPPADS